MIFAEISEAGWLAIVTMLSNVVLAVIGVAALWVKNSGDKQRAEQAADQRSASTAMAEKAAAKAEEAATATKEMAEATNRAVEVVHKATNSMKDDLVAEVRAASFAAGQKDQKESPK